MLEWSVDVAGGVVKGGSVLDVGNGDEHITGDVKEDSVFGGAGGVVKSGVHDGAIDECGTRNGEYKVFSGATKGWK